MNRNRLRAGAASLLCLLLCVAAACTQNNGYIGKLFGQWYLESIEAEGMELPDYEDNIFWGFQSKILKMTMTLPEHQNINTSGNFRLEDNTLFISFPDEGQAPFLPLGLPRDAELQVLRLDGSSMILLYEPQAGQTATYRFRKW